MVLRKCYIEVFERWALRRRFENAFEYLLFLGKTAAFKSIRKAENLIIASAELKHITNFYILRMTPIS